MSEVIENFIRRNPGLSEKDAFEGFLNEERIKAWVGTDETRKERLRKEFGRVWGGMHVDVQPQGPKAGPAGPQLRAGPRSVHVEVRPEVDTRPLAPPGTPGAPIRGDMAHGVGAVGGGRHLQVLCANCKRIEVWMDDDHQIACRRCGRVYDDMLALVRVTPVGPFAFLFGEGWKGAATGGAIVVGLLALYVLFTRVL